jgi:hypothetical protein
MNEILETTKFVVENSSFVSIHDNRIAEFCVTFNENRPVPFTDLSGAKRRPALVVSNPVEQDIVLCQITTQTGEQVIPLQSADFETGKLEVNSYSKKPKYLNN